jgi:hypothetical protein
LIMLFVLAIGSLIGLMSTNSVQDMITSTWSLRDFYQSYYLSKWWLELWILATNKYEYGFEDNLSGTESIIKNNLNCKKDCNLSINITSRVRSSTNESIIFWITPEAIQTCNAFAKNRILLSGWSSYILPLFADQRKLQWWTDIKNLLEDQSYSLSIQSDQQNNSLWIGVTLWSWFKNIYEWQSSTGKQSLYMTGTINDTYIHNIDKFLYDSKPLVAWTQPLQSEQSIGRIFWSSIGLIEKENFNYLFITNLSEQPYAFCLQAEHNTDGYTVDNAIVTSIWSYWTTTLGLQANIKKPLPDYIINSYSEYQN